MVYISFLDMEIKTPDSPVAEGLKQNYWILNLLQCMSARTLKSNYIHGWFNNPALTYLNSRLDWPKETCRSIHIYMFFGLICRHHYKWSHRNLRKLKIKFSWAVPEDMHAISLFKIGPRICRKLYISMTLIIGWLSVSFSRHWQNASYDTAEHKSDLALTNLITWILTFRFIFTFINVNFFARFTNFPFAV